MYSQRGVGAGVLFERPAIRPEPLVMAGLVEAGVTEADIVAAGLRRGHSADNIEAELADLPAIAPHVDELSAAIADRHDGETLLFAGRDAEVLYDHSKVAYPHLPSYLLPASEPLWQNDRRTGVAGEHGAAFLAQYGMDAASLHDENRRYKIIEPAAYGSILLHLKNSIFKLYGADGFGAMERMSIDLVAPERLAVGPAIIQYTADQVPMNQEQLPHTAARLGSFLFEKIRSWPDNPPQTMMAVAMQLLPRFHDAYEYLVATRSGVVRAMPRRPYADMDILSGRAENDSVINPVAAAIAQFRIVRRAIDVS